MKKLYVLIVIFLIILAIPTVRFSGFFDSDSDGETISPVFIYKIDGYHVYVDARDSQGTNLNFTWTWGDEKEENRTFDHSIMAIHTYYHRWHTYTITLTLRNSDEHSKSTSISIAVPDYKIGICPVDAGPCPTADSFRIRYSYDINNIGRSLQYYDTPISGELPNKWAIVSTCCSTNNTAWGVEADYYPGIRTLKKIGFPEEHFVYLENFTFTPACIRKSLLYIKETSPDFQNATVVLYIVTHGSSSETNSRIWLFEDDTEELEDTTMWDHEFRDLLLQYRPAKFLFITCACESGFFANEDTSGTLYGETAGAYENPSMPGRVIFTGSMAPLSTSGAVVGKGFWEKGIGDNKGDSAPTGNGDGTTSVEEAFFYCKTMANMDDTITATSQPCLDDRYPSENPEDGELIL